jgi:hypothetical protein
MQFIILLPTDENNLLDEFKQIEDLNVTTIQTKRSVALVKPTVYNHDQITVCVRI